MDHEATIFIAGHQEAKEQAIIEYFEAEGYRRLLTAGAVDLDTLNRQAVDDFFKDYQPEYVILDSLASQDTAKPPHRPAEYFLMNMMSQTQIIDAAYRLGSKKLLYLADSDVYPRQCPQPMREDYVVTGPLDPQSQSSAISQIAGIAMCEAYRLQYRFNAVVAIAPSIYGPRKEEGDDQSGFLSDLVELFIQAAADRREKVRVLKNPDIRREFLFSEDFASACEFLMRHYEEAEPINIGSGVDIATRDLAEMIRDISGFEGTIEYDEKIQDEDFQRLLEVSPIQTRGWMAKTVLREGLVRLWEAALKKGLLI